MTRVGIIGVGLIGGSLGLALRRVRRSGIRSYTITGWSPSPATLRAAKKRGALDSGVPSLKEVVREADVVVLCTPVQAMSKIVVDILPFMKSGAILSDVGSTKQTIHSQISRLIKKRKDVSFVGAHPLAGSEKFGVKHADAKLFINAICVMTSKNNLVKRMWNDVGSSVVFLDPRRHDQILALTSHWPHVMSFALFSVFLKLRKKWPLSEKLTAGSFHAMTRVAGSEPSMWGGIMAQNRSALLAVKKEFNAVVNHLLSNSEQTQRLTSISQAKQQWQK